MIRKEDLRTIIMEQYEQLESTRNTVPRKINNPPDLSGAQAIVITGVRRSGKSTFLRQLMNQSGSFNFLTFEDIRLAGFQTEDFIKVEEVFKEEFGEKEFFFFDEIQNISGWELYVRQKLDMKKHVALTGSNARLLSRELGTHLTGRHLDYEIFPFSFSEYLDYSKRSLSLSSFQDYFTNGGFPEFLQQNKTEYLQHLLEDVLIRDIAIRHGIRNIRVLKEMVVYLLSNLGKEFSYQMLRRTFDLGAASTVIEYISFLEDSYLLFTISKFDYSLRKQAYNPKKVYAVDNGLAIVNSLSFSSDSGRMLENLVFITLRRKTKEIFYFKGKKECDFVVRERGSITAVIQVCYQINMDNKAREIEGLTEAMMFFGLKEGLLLTMNEDDVLIKDGLTIRLCSVWKWLCEV